MHVHYNNGICDEDINYTKHARELGSWSVPIYIMKAFNQLMNPSPFMYIQHMPHSQVQLSPQCSLLCGQTW